MAKSRLSKTLKKEMIIFLETHHPASFNRNMRNVLLDYLHHEADIGFPLYMKQFLWSMHDFFNLMDVAEQETAGWKRG